MEPSKVIHVSRIPPDCVESELIELAEPFGNVIKTLIVGRKQHAFIEMESKDAAANLIEQFMASQAFIRELPITCTYSNRQTITPNSRYPTGGGGGGGGGSGSYSSYDKDDAPMEPRTGGPDGTPNTILLVTILNMRVRVTLENIYQVFRSFGEVLRIVTFEKSNFQALVEFSNLSSAIQAKSKLEQKDMFQGCCTLMITFSSRAPPLRVVANNHRSRDFTVTDSREGMFSGQGNFQQHQQSGFGSQQSYEYGSQRGGSYRDQGGGYGPFSGYSGEGGMEGSVLLVHNLDQDKVNPDVLQTLFGVYGDVLRVKILYHKKDNALIQMANSQQAALAKRYLDKAMLYGQELAILFSKHSSVQLPPPHSKLDSSDLVKDFSESKLHRFKIPNSRNELHIAAPAATLHISNLPDITEEELTTLFGEEEDKEGGVVTVKLFGKDRHMAFITFETVEAGIHNLIRFHNHNVKGKHIKLTFSHVRSRHTMDGL